MTVQPKTKLNVNEVHRSRQLLIERVQHTRKMIVSLLESGDRDYDQLREMTEMFIDAQKAADALGYPTQIVEGPMSDKASH